MRRISTNFRQIVASSGIGMLFRVFGLGTTFLSTLLITRLFGVDSYGDYSLVFTVCQAVSMIFALGIPNALIKIIGNHGYDAHQARRLLLRALLMTLAGALLPVAVFALGAGFFSDEVFRKPDLQPFFYLVALTIPAGILHELFLYYFIATRKFLKYNLFMFVIPNVLLILFLMGCYRLQLDGPYLFLAFGLSLGTTLLLEALLVFFRRLPKGGIILRRRQILTISSPMMFSSLLLYLLNWTDVFMLGPVASDAQIGIYNIAYKVGTVGFVVIVSVSTIITPRIAELFGRNELSEMRSLIQNATRLIAAITIPFVLVLCLLGHFILNLFSPEAEQGYLTLLLVSAGVLFSAICGNVDQVLNMTNNHRLLRNITFGCLLLNIVLNVFLIPNYGIEGAAAASLVTNVALNAISMYYMRRRLGFSSLAFLDRLLWK